jgi:exodeoxyribonuclease VII small subunit
LHARVFNIIVLAMSPGEDEGFDRVLARLAAAVEKLEQGNLTLEESLRIFEEGVTLARRGHALLDAAEQRVEILVRGEAGADTVAPFKATE